MMKPAIFLDRDGVVVVENRKITPPGEIKLYPYAKACIEELSNMGYLVIIVTNQSGVARGIFSVEELEAAHRRIKEQTKISEIYYCPHHIEGKIKKYAVDCDCRKPKRGLIDQALKDFEIDLNKSIMIGDRKSDILLGTNIGVRTVLVESGYGKDEEEAREIADEIYLDLEDFVNSLKGVRV